MSFLSSNLTKMVYFNYFQSVRVERYRDAGDVLLLPRVKFAVRVSPVQQGAGAAIL